MSNIQHYPIFTNENLYSNQINWILKQIENCKDDSFNDIAKAKSKIGELTIIRLDKEQPNKQLQCNLKLAERNLHGFRNTFLSDSGFQKLSITLKVARKRISDKNKGAKKLDVTVSHEAFDRLDEIVKNTGLTKTAIIEDLLLNHDQKFGMFLTDSKNQIETIPSDAKIPDTKPKKWIVFHRFAQIKPGVVMRQLHSKQEYIVARLDGKTIYFKNGYDLNAYEAKQKYEIHTPE